MTEGMDLEMEQVTAVTADYGEEQIQVLEGLEAVAEALGCTVDYTTNAAGSTEAVFIRK